MRASSDINLFEKKKRNRSSFLNNPTWVVFFAISRFGIPFSGSCPFCLPLLFEIYCSFSKLLFRFKRKRSATIFRNSQIHSEVKWNSPRKFDVGRDEHNVLSFLFTNKSLFYTKGRQVLTWPSFGFQNKTKNDFRLGLWTVFFSSQNRHFFSESPVFWWFISKRAASN